MKRFTDTEKWSNPWFRKLPSHLKCLWLFMCDRCDASGVWDCDWDQVEFFLGQAIAEEDALSAFGHRVRRINNHVEANRPCGEANRPHVERWQICKFIPFQYGELSANCKPHAVILALLRDHKIPLPIPYPKGIPYATGKGKEQEQEKEKDPDLGVEGKGTGENPSGGNDEVSRPDLKEVLDFSQRIGLAEWKARDFFDEMESCGWKDWNRRVVVKWQPMLTRVCRKWEADGRPSGPPNSNARPSQSKPDHRAEKAAKEYPQVIKGKLLK